ncbi:peptidoglycan-binding protein [Alkalihalophilus lindianensis]|uniref:Peptidoglycan-binding protein n=1 Tax=Alkalihalophilus lindianensis TaxID=1630542 RepID=A0ABU3X8Y2_9BACI|nr:peptidoglycan-binding protein [Alkalihalophilus lindianensis]MDV2684342.1 peptidoglycan-binding protein [Alkalihalophilus lindianensis]
MKKVLLTSLVAAGLLLANPSVSDAALGDQTLRMGMSHGDVTELQQALKSKGYFKFDRATGYYGTITRDAVRQFQASNNLSVDGIAGPQTFRALGASGGQAPASTSSNTSTASSSGVLRVGSRGSAVTSLQQQLRDKGHFSSSIDGVYGPLTQRGVRSFQSAMGLSVDGIAGPQTFNALSSGVVASASTSSSSSSSSASSSSSVNASSLVSFARSLTGTPYRFGGTTTSGFDCSGFIQYVFRNQGVSVPRTAAQQWSAGTTVSNPQVGDLVFFETYKAGPSHNGIYIGNNQFIHSGSSTGVTVSSMSNTYWAPRYLGAKRVN